MRIPFISLILSATALAASPEPPRIIGWETALLNYINASERDQILKLAGYFPRLYAFRFICQFRGPGANPAPVTVLPGEWVDAPDGGTLHCPDHYRVEIDKLTRLRVQQFGSVPNFLVERGQIRVNFGTDPLFVETSGFSAATIGALSTPQRLIVSESAKEHALGCDLGATVMNLTEKKGADGVSSLFAHNCQLEVAPDGGAVHRFLFSGDDVMIPNLMTPRQFWPRPTGKANTSFKPEPMSIDLQVILNGTETAVAHWTINGFVPNIPCSFYLQKSELETPVELNKVPTPYIGTGNQELNKEFGQGYLSMRCLFGESVITSNAAHIPTP